MVIYACHWFNIHYSWDRITTKVVVEMSNVSSFFKGLKQGMILFGHTIAGIINAILLSIVYVMGVGVTSIIAKLCKKHFLELKPKKEVKTYWDNLDIKTKTKQDYLRQF